MSDTSNITLRPLRMTDLSHFMTWAGDPLVTASLFWDHYTEEATAKQFLQTVAETHPWFMAMWYEDRAVGAITLDQHVGKDRCRAELGYCLARAYWGRGIATAAVRIALRRGFTDLRVQRIEAFVDPNNIASIRVLEKAGLTREGLLKQYVIHRGHLRDRFIYATQSNTCATKGAGR